MVSFEGHYSLPFRTSVMGSTEILSCVCISYYVGFGRFLGLSESHATRSRGITLATLACVAMSSRN